MQSCVMAGQTCYMGVYLQSKSVTFAEDILLSAILPEASTTKMTKAPALRARRLLRMSDFSTYTLRGVCPSASARALRILWYGAAVRSVASTASLFTLLPAYNLCQG